MSGQIFSLKNWPSKRAIENFNTNDMYTFYYLFERSEV